VILAIDQGTTGTTCLVFDREGLIVGRAYSEFEQHFPRPGVEQVAVEVERVVRESRRKIQEVAEVELYLRAARDPELHDASRRCFDAYEEVAVAALEALQIPDPERHARSIVALMYGLALRRLGTGEEDVSGLAEALLTIVRGAQAGA